MNLTAIPVSKDNSIRLNMPNYLAIIYSTDGKKKIIKGAGMLTQRRKAHDKLLEVLRTVKKEFECNSLNITLITIKSNGTFPKEMENKLIEIANKHFTRLGNKKEYFIDSRKRTFKSYLLFLSSRHNIQFGKIYSMKNNYIVDEDINYMSESGEDNDSDYMCESEQDDSD